MKRYIGYVEEIDWANNLCRVRIPNLDGLETLAYIDPVIALMRQNRTATQDLEEAAIPYHMQGLRLHDIVYCLESEEENDIYTLVGFYGGTAEEEG